MSMKINCPCLLLKLRNLLTFRTSIRYCSQVMSSVKRTLNDEDNNDTEEEAIGIVTENEDKKSAHNKRQRTELIASLDVSDYYIENGLRKVYPYNFTYYAYCKGRWVGSKLKDLFAKEFRAISDSIMLSRVEKGFLKVNDQPVNLDYVLKNNDFITNQIHRHEFPVLAAPIPIIHMDDDLLVVDKPPSLPVHPCGKFRLNSITSLLEKENKIKDIHIVHRLDRLTSGVMIMARTKAKAQKLHELMRNREMHKEYICRVEGLFPDGVVECEQPIETLSHKLALCIVSPNGKHSKTVFERLNYNGKSSTVLCKPLTGRMHQIRVHLQYLGYPIVNDNLYNSIAFGSAKGKGGEYGKTLEELVKDIENEHNRSKYIIETNSESKPLVEENDQIENTEKKNKDTWALEALQHYTAQEDWIQMQQCYTKDESRIKYEEDCEECQIRTCDPTPSEQFFYLHALRYKGPGWCYESKMPIWAQESWIHD